MSDTYFSDREFGSKPRDLQDITPSAWRGIVGAVESLIESGAFGLDFPERCPERDWTIGTNQTTLSLAVQGEIPDLEWPLQTVKSDKSMFGEFNVEPYVPPVAPTLDLVEFCYKHVAQPIREEDRLHPYYGHHHLDFDRETGREAFLTQINRIFARNGLAYELRSGGQVERLAPPILQESLRSAVFNTGDQGLDDLLENARNKFLSHDVQIRRDSLEKLWDAWERLKTLEATRKDLSIGLLLDRVTNEPTLRAILEAESRLLTKIGNDFQIRHSEIGKVQVGNSAHVDYLFHRLFALMLLILERRSSTQP
ncbi:MAG: AbiJ-NTD4 domain-containing protein [Pyrinomonadaceae bacterium]